MTSLVGVAAEFARLLAQQSVGALSELAFTEPAGPLSASSLDALGLVGNPIGNDIVSRPCCALGGTGSPSLKLDDIRSGKHEYRPHTSGSALGMLPGGGVSGFVYTRRGGFIDLGHARDYADYTRFFSAKFFHAMNQGGAQALFSEEAYIHLVVAPRSAKPDPAVAALVGATLAYQRAIWHEIVTYFPAPGILPDQKYSSFAPEDNFSNAVGALIGYRAFTAPGKPFNSAVDEHLMKLLDTLGAVDKTTTEQATAYVKDHWWQSGVLFDGLTPNALRRNLDAFSPVRPWLVTEIAVPNRESKGAQLRKQLGRPAPASIMFPESLGGQKLADLAWLEFRAPSARLEPILPPSVRALPQNERVIKADMLPEIVGALRDKVQTEEGLGRDEPGPPVPAGP